MATYQRKPDGARYHPAYDRIMEHQGYALRIHWSTSMLDYLRRHYPTTLNEELAGCLGVSQRTMIRKARELGLEKDKQWLAEVWDERRRMAHIISKRKGYPGGFKKGERANPDGEFKKGRQPSAEETAKRSESMKQWYRKNRLKAKEKARKAWETRRRNSCQSVQSVVVFHGIILNSQFSIINFPNGNKETNLTDGAGAGADDHGGVSALPARHAGAAEGRQRGNHPRRQTAHQTAGHRHQYPEPGNEGRHPRRPIYPEHSGAGADRKAKQKEVTTTTKAEGLASDSENEVAI